MMACAFVAVYPQQTFNFVYSTAIRINDYVHFSGHPWVKSFGIRIPSRYVVHGIDVSRWQQRIDWQRVAGMRDGGIQLRFAFIKATESENRVDPYFSYNWRQSKKMACCAAHITIFHPRYRHRSRRGCICKRLIWPKATFPPYWM